MVLVVEVLQSHAIEHAIKVELILVKRCGGFLWNLNHMAGPDDIPEIFKMFSEQQSMVYYNYDLVLVCQDPSFQNHFC